MDKAALKKLIEEKFQSTLDYINAQPDELFTTRVIPEKWNNGEHLDHLRKTARSISKGMAMPKLILKFKFGVNKRSEHSYTELQEKFRQYVVEPKKSPRSLVPNVSADDRKRITDWFLEERDSMLTTIDNHSEKQLSKYVLPHPYVGNLTFREFIYFAAIHNDHHIGLMKKYNVNFSNPS